MRVATPAEGLDTSDIVDAAGTVYRSPRRAPRSVLVVASLLAAWTVYAAGFYSRRLGEAAGVSIPDPDYPIREAVELIQSALVPATTPTPPIYLPSSFVTTGSALLTFSDFGSTGEISTPTVTIHADGTVTVRAGVTLDSASMDFWRAVGSYGALRGGCE